MRFGRRGLLMGAALIAATGHASCSLEPKPFDHGPIAENVSGKLGDPVPYATSEQLAAFERGREVANRRFSRADGLGPAFNVTFCGSCHERPVTGGGAGLYRNFFLGGLQVEGGGFFPLESAGTSGGVVRMYAYGEELPAHPGAPDDANVIAQRNPIPFFGMGLLAELDEEEILSRADPDDGDGDGISGRPNYDRGFVGRFGRKAQTVSLEGFIRGPLFNHLGVTSDPLDEAQKAALPVDSSGGTARSALRWLGNELSRAAQAAAPDGPLTDDDDAPDPELSTDDLFDLVSFAMLLAAPEVETDLDPQQLVGRDRFNDLGCYKCHAPRLASPRGPLPVYSDLLLHDMGDALADGLFQGEATGREFRTQPLWGLSAVGPYLHDGRATTVEQAILMHGGEAERARNAFAALGRENRDAVLAFLDTLGGRDQRSPGLIPPDAPLPEPGTPGGPVADATQREREAFTLGRELFDRDIGFAEGVGAPRFNGDSCRACHFEPVVGGSGPRGVNVIRHGILNDEGRFAVPAVGTILHRSTSLRGQAIRPQKETRVFELRQTPPLFGLGLIDTIPEDAILANADPDDVITPDGISGKPSWTDGSRLGRFGWKAQVPTLHEFARDAATTELGLAIPLEEGLTFGAIHDTDDIPDPEIGTDYLAGLTDFMSLLAPIARATPDDPALAAEGEALFTDVGCAACHVPSLPGADGDVPLFSDLLLHEILPENARGIEDASANERELRTAPLWGIRLSGPYLHDGRADTLREAIVGHDGEAKESRERFLSLDEDAQAALLAFLGTL
jgi:CxxC motif-containing protein (DUF1111 family)